MRFYRFFISQLLVACMIISANAASCQTFADVSPSDWYYESAVTALSNGLVRDSSGLLQPNEAATTADTAKAIFNACDIYVPLPDIGEPWYTPYLEKTGDYLDTPLPYRSITRYETAALLYEVIGLESSLSFTGYTDTDASYLDAVKAAGLMEGTLVNGKLAFDGNRALTNAELVTVAARIYELVGNKGAETTSWYENVAGTGAFIPANTPLPDDPMTVEAFEQVFDYIAVNDLTELTIEYSVPYMADYKQAVSNAMSQMGSYYYIYPEYFNYFRFTSRFHTNSDGNMCYIICIQPSDIGDHDPIQMRREAFESAVKVYNELCESGRLSKSMSERERAKVMLDYIIDHADYKDSSDRVGHTAWSLFRNGTGVCDAYTSAYNLLLRLDGITCWGRYASTADGGLHEWTVAYLDGELVNIDATWCDGWSGVDRYHYFDVADEVFMQKGYTWQN